MATDKMTETSTKSRILDPALLKVITERIVAAYDPELVILFGSYAEGHPTPESDIDLLVVTEAAMSLRERWEKRRGLYHHTEIPIQILTISQERFEETRGVIGGIAYPAVKYGKVIYEKS